MTIPDTHVVLDVGISCCISDDDDGCSTLDLEGRNLYDALTKMPLPLLLCPVVLQARKCHVEYAAPAIVALKHEGRWPHKETLDIDYVVERLWHWRYLPACNKHCTYCKRCDKLAHNEHFEEREGLCVHGEITFIADSTFAPCWSRGGTRETTLAEDLPSAYELDNTVIVMSPNGNRLSLQ